jgi:hypothetical protein
MRDIKNTDSDDRKLNPDELAARLQVPISWVYKQTRERGPDAMPFLKVGKYCRFELEKVLEWSRRRSEK